MKSQNVRFSDQHNGPTTTIDGREDVTRSLTDTNDTELSDFFSRPIKIFEIEWGVGGNVDSFINPWQLYFDNVRVTNRITNYNLMRANLHLKFVINGNGFYFGRVAAMYGPFGGTSFDTLSSTLAFWDLTQWTQRPKIFLDPSTSMGGEMVIPFHYYANNCNVQRREVDNLGRMWIRSLNGLQHANGATDSVNISVFAWAENVNLSVLTSFDITGLTPQAGEVDEANTKGMISKPATAISKWAGYFSSVPVIGPYARATEKAASVTAEIAKSFGYCRPTMTRAPEPYRPTPVSSLANTNVPDVVQKLTVDDKQELTIDPIVAGIGSHDPLSIKSIACRESLIAQFNWNVSNITEDLLFNMVVDPCVWQETGISPTIYHIPAVCAAALPFKYWTGTLKYRFQVVCSKFHKGRLKIVYDPNEFDGREYNVNYMKIVDLAEETDVTFTVGVGKETTLLEHVLPGTTNFANTQRPITSIPFNASVSNGVIGVFVVNKLGVPNSTVSNNISINVYVSACDDFEVFVPDSYFQQFVVRPTTPAAAAAEEEKMDNQSGEVMTDKETTEEPNAPEQTMSENIAVSTGNFPETNLVFTGESIQSFRTLLKRYYRWTATGNVQTITANIRLRMQMFPYLRGEVANAVDLTVSANPYNYCNTVLLHWVTLMFSGWRGSIRYKIIPRIVTGYNDIAVQRYPPDRTSFNYTRVVNINPLPSLNTIPFNTVYVASLTDASMSGHNGVAYTNSTINPVLEYELPYYNKYRFVPGKTQSWTAPTLYPFTEEQVVSINTMQEYGGNGFDQVNPAGTFEFWVAAGEDFQTFFFTGLPRLYYEPVPPAPAV